MKWRKKNQGVQNDLPNQRQRAPEIVPARDTLLDGIFKGPPWAHGPGARPWFLAGVASLRGDGAAPLILFTTPEQLCGALLEPFVEAAGAGRIAIFARVDLIKTTVFKVFKVDADGDSEELEYQLFPGVVKSYGARGILRGGAAREGSLSVRGRDGSIF